MPHFDRDTGVKDPAIGHNDSVLGDGDDPMDEAAQALREAEVEVVQPTPPPTDHMRLENMSIDELRACAAKLDVPNRGAIIEREHLIAAIRERM